MTMSAAAAERLRDLLGQGEVTEAFGDVHLDVPAGSWLDTLRTAHQTGLIFLDWLSAYEDPPRLAVVAHLVDPTSGERVLVRTDVPVGEPRLASATGIWPGAAWHERETAEMFGVVFDGHPDPAPLLLHPDFDGHPLRKDFVLASRAAKPWPGAKDPSDRPDRPRRRAPQPPGAPPEGWLQP